jgi:predicted GIY-YIG superfamily endonuclease
MYYLYRIQSLEQKDKFFLDTTRNVKKRLAMHNKRKVDKTADFAPYRVSFYAAFTRRERAEAFKAFLETDEGKSFGDQHLWSSPSSSNLHDTT